ncbi:hypothetical protein RV18_GL002749 [Enterococcus termitis]|nr:hypothetical protein RV18_GL002749 [Enterococcus termitis]
MKLRGYDNLTKLQKKLIQHKVLSSYFDFSKLLKKAFDLLNNA